MTPEAEVRRLLDQRAIEALLARYARTLDWLDEEGQASCYWPDAAIDYGFFAGTAAEFVPVVMGIERAAVRRWHFLGSLALAFTGDDAAEGECYGLAAGVRAGEDGVLAGTVYGGRYLDRFARRAGEWRIAARRYVLDWMLPLPAQPGDSPAAAFPLPILSVAAGGHPLYRPM